MINDLRQAIIQRLQPLASRARIVGDDSEGEAGAKSQVRSDYTIRVSYASGTFEQPQSTEDVPFQNADRAFQVAIEVRDLRSETKTVQLLEDVEQLLIGFRPCLKGVAGAFYLQGDRFQQNQDGVYFYVVNLAISCFLLKG